MPFQGFSTTTYLWRKAKNAQPPAKRKSQPKPRKPRDRSPLAKLNRKRRRRARGNATKWQKRRRRELLKAKTIYEERMARWLRASGMGARQQWPVGRYFADFLWKHVVIELDGGHHNEEPQRSYDAERDKYMKTNGFAVVRLWNRDCIEGNAEAAIQCIRNAKAGQVTRFQPSPT